MRSSAGTGNGGSGEGRPNKASVVRGLLAELLLGQWQGGDRLTELDTCARFQVSRTPVREALFALEGLGLIELRRNCGAVARRFEAEDLGEIYAVRAVLEVEAVRLAARHQEKERWETLRRRCQALREAGEIDTDWELDRALHGAIAGASGNRRLAREIARYGDLIQTVREIVGAQALGIHETTVEEHLAILEALLDGDAGWAGKAMRAHLRQASESAMAAMRFLRRNGKGAMSDERFEGEKRLGERIPLA